MEKCYAMVLEEPGKFVKKEFPIPEPGDRDLLLRVEMVSICGSDRLLYRGSHRLSSFPKILGHEVVGYVDRLGAAAKREYGVDVGDRVTVEPYIACNKCEYCLTGLYQAHLPHMTYGVALNCDKPPYLWGAYSQYLFVAPGSRLHRIAPEVPAEAACLSSVIGNGVRWVRTKGEVRYGESVAIVGAGAQGLASVVAAKESGAYPIMVIGLTKDRVKFEVAREFGADFIIDLQKTDPAEEVRRITGGKMADVVIECAGVPASVQTAFRLPRDCGRVVLAGVNGGREVPLKTDVIVNNELVVRGGHGQSWDVGEAALINSRKYAVEKMISHRFPLEKAEEAMRLFLEGPEDCIRIGLVPESGPRKV